MLLADWSRYCDQILRRHLLWWSPWCESWQRLRWRGDSWLQHLVSLHRPSLINFPAVPGHKVPDCMRLKFKKKKTIKEDMFEERFTLQWDLLFYCRLSRSSGHVHLYRLHWAREHGQVVVVGGATGGLEPQPFGGQAVWHQFNPLSINSFQQWFNQLT